MKQGGDPRRFGCDISEAEFFFYLRYHWINTNRTLIVKQNVHCVVSCVICVSLQCEVEFGFCISTTVSARQPQPFQHSSCIRLHGISQTQARYWQHGRWGFKYHEFEFQCLRHNMT
jgi:hypothetical protein